VGRREPALNNKNRITNPGFTYDDAGNLASDGFLSYSWDAENRLTTTNNVSYTYDGDGRRVKKSSGTLYWYGVNGQVLEETDLSGNLLNDYVYFNGQRVARVDASGGKYSYFSGPLGSTALVWGPGGTKQELDYYPFGGERVITNTLENHYKFTGMERDSESGLDHTLYRQYASNLGRWLSPDPDGGSVSNPQSLNRYGYVTNNPTNFTDPLGLRLMWGDVFDGGGSAAGLYGSLSYGASGGTASFTVDGLDVPASIAQPLLANGAVVNATTAVTQTQTVTAHLPSGCVSVNGEPPTCDQPSTTTFTVTTTQTVNDVPLSPEAAYVLGTAGSIAAPVADPWFYAYWTAGAAATGLVIVPGAGAAAVGAVNEGLTSVEAAQPGTIQFVNDVATGLSPSPPPPTVGGAVGVVLYQIYNWLFGR